MSEQFDSWAIVELMGHVRMAGRLTEEERFGTNMGRLDIPDGDGFVTQYFGGSSVYRITPVSEDAARAAARQNVPRPVHQWELPKPGPKPVPEEDRFADGGYPRDDDDEDDEEMPF